MLVELSNESRNWRKPLPGEIYPASTKAMLLSNKSKYTQAASNTLACCQAAVCWRCFHELIRNEVHNVS